MPGLPEFLVNNRLIGEGKILIERQVWQTIMPHRQKDMAAPEAGGILLGYRRGEHLHVIDATVPQAEDRRSRMRFARAKRPHQDIALARWKEGSGTIDYLGDWHTHPEFNPAPSALDTSEWRKISEPRVVPMLFVILGWSSTVWVGVGTGAQLDGRRYMYSN
jgi:integrative and conjugative element protein (TIGR02256 family)